MNTANIYRAGLFDGHVAIVTGGGSGIGLAIAKSLAELGAKVAICGRKQERLDEAKKVLGSSLAFSSVCDIREPEQIAVFVDSVEERARPADILVNNAGGQFPTTAESVSLARLGSRHPQQPERHFLHDAGGGHEAHHPRGKKAAS